MTDSEMNIALAEFEGWKREVFISPLDNETEIELWRKQDKRLLTSATISDYGSSLDACHRVEVKLSKEGQSQRYYVALSILTQNENKDDARIMFKRVCATAPQRREALCRTLWPERFTARDSLTTGGGE